MIFGLKKDGGLQLCVDYFYSEMAELQCRKPIMNTAQHLLLHPKGMCLKEQFHLKDWTKRVRGMELWPGHEEPHTLHRSMKSPQDCTGPRAGKHRVYIGIIWYHDVYLLWGHPNLYCLLFSPSPLFLYLPMPLPLLCQTLFSMCLLPTSTCFPLQNWVVVVVKVVVRNGFSHNNSSLALCANHTAPVSSHITLYPNLKQYKNHIDPKEIHRSKGKP